MNKVLQNGLWVLLVIAAYLVGTMQRGDVPESAASPPLVADAKGRLRSPQGGSRARNAQAATGRSIEAEAWLDRFRGPDRLISAARMEDAVAAVLLESDPVAATLYFARLLEELTTDNAPAALQALNDSGRGGNALQFLSLLAFAWGRLDGETAVAAFVTVRGRGAEAAKIAALAAWAASDPAAATAWLQNRVSSEDPTRDRRDDAAWARGLLTGLARRDIDGALQTLMTMFPEEQGRYVDVLIEEKLKEGVEAGADWAMQLPVEKMRTNALESVGMRFISQDLDGAKLYAGSIADRPDAHELVADVADALASRDAAEAAAWVGTLPAGPSQDHAYEDLFENWTRTDALAASRTLTEMEAGPVRDNAVLAFSKTLARENPENALQWAGTMTDSQQRSDVQVDLARRWQRSSPREADAWVAANFPPELQVRVPPAAP